MGWPTQYRTKRGLIHWTAHWYDENGKHASKSLGPVGEEKALAYARSQEDLVAAKRHSVTLDVDAAFDAFLLHAADEKSEATVDLYQRFLGLILNEWRDRPTHEWTEDEFRVFLRRWRGKLGSQYQFVRSARQFIKWAAGGRFDVPDFVGAFRPRRAPATSPDTLDRDQRRALILGSEGSRVEVAIALAAGMGLRPREWRAARPDDVRWSDRKLRVHRKGRRDQELPIPPTVFGILDRTRLAPMIVGEVHTVTATRSRQILSSVCSKAGLPVMTWYSLRHTALTLLAERQPLHVVQRYAGHSSLKSTQVYLHAQEHHLRAAAEEDL